MWEAKFCTNHCCHNTFTMVS